MNKTTRLNGVTASIGVAVGPARVIERERRRISYRQIADSAVSTELKRFEDARNPRQALVVITSPARKSRRQSRS